ncbi:MAG: phosphatidylserine decarboxylase family protein [Flavobacteriales bacterium]|jgi:phosphatidylserine decarboxylase|nr:MAG: phosphatidylserine decarboxylase family protein [Flavobacteriales bacterium]
MIRIHPEGRRILATTFFSLAIINFLLYQFVGRHWLTHAVIILSIIIYILVLQFFRNPKRNIQPDPNIVIAPADGKVVVIENVTEDEYFKGERLQVSIFMSPLNVHVNRYPIGGKIKFAKYHPGKYLVAWHPKSSTLNERTTVVVENESIGPVLYRQIAGAVARRIVMYPKEGMVVQQGADSGFIKFGSRLDIFLPPDTPVNVKIGDVVKGGETIIYRK